MDWWRDAQIAGVRIAAAPAKHGVPENTYVFVTASGVVYFAGDTLLIPELDEIGVRFPTIDLMLVATNGLRVKPMFNRKMVMDANDAAQLSARLHPKVVIPMHYAFEARDWFHDTFLIAYERGPQHFVDACHRLVPDVEVLVASPGRQVVLNGSSRSRSIGSTENSQDA
jgi:L-ascorbate metabolism protein UlaG (beta-lactamase superfamily)